MSFDHYWGYHVNALCKDIQFKLKIEICFHNYFIIIIDKVLISCYFDFLQLFSIVAIDIALLKLICIILFAELQWLQNNFCTIL